MNCDDMTGDLVAFHFGELEDRAAVEAHLSGCGACLAVYFALKRTSERAEDVPAPPPHMKSRLRSAVAVELGLSPPKRRGWERPAAIALAACVVLGAGEVTRRLTDGPGRPPHAMTVAGDGASPRN